MMTLIVSAGFMKEELETTNGKKMKLLAKIHKINPLTANVPVT